MATQNSSSKTCMVLAAGCGCLMLLVAMVVAGVAFWGVQTAKKTIENLEDPTAQAERARDLLGAGELPEGYHAEIALEIPWVMRMAILSDGEPPEPPQLEAPPIPEAPEAPPAPDGPAIDEPSAAKPEPPQAPQEPATEIEVETEDPTEGELIPDTDGEHVFLFFEFLAGAQAAMSPEDRRVVTDFFTGTRDDLRALEENGVRVDLRDVLRRGSLSAAGAQLRYVVGVGDLDEMRRREQLLALFLAECPQDQRMRIAIWSGPFPETIGPDDAPVLTGTVGDEAEMLPFLDYFDFCR
jgi:type IV secretory pathway VirB10-like protein